MCARHHWRARRRAHNAACACLLPRGRGQTELGGRQTVAKQRRVSRQGSTRERRGPPLHLGNSDSQGLYLQIRLLPQMRTSETLVHEESSLLPRKNAGNIPQPHNAPSPHVAAMPSRPPPLALGLGASSAKTRRPPPRHRPPRRAASRKRTTPEPTSRRDRTHRSVAKDRRDVALPAAARMTARARRGGGQGVTPKWERGW